MLVSYSLTGMNEVRVSAHELLSTKERIQTVDFKKDSFIFGLKSLSV